MSVDSLGLLLFSTATSTPSLRSTLSFSAIYVSVTLTAAASTPSSTRSLPLESPLRKERLLDVTLRQTVQCASW